jgi:hypothetical protein
MTLRSFKKEDSTHGGLGLDSGLLIDNQRRQRPFPVRYQNVSAWRGPLLRTPVHGYSSLLASSDRRGRPLGAQVIALSEQTVSPRPRRHPCPVGRKY